LERNILHISEKANEYPGNRVTSYKFQVVLASDPWQLPVLPDHILRASPYSPIAEKSIFIKKIWFFNLKKRLMECILKT